MSNLWHTYFYKPLFNALIYLYNNYANFNLGLAVVYLTILLRIVLLPLSIISGKSKEFYNDLAKKINEAKNDYANDIVKQKEAIREILRKKGAHPWAKAITLGVQLLVLIVLYQVFIGGITATAKFQDLYPIVIRPDFINTQFLWVDISQRNFLLSIIVAIILFVQISIIQRGKGEIVDQRDMVYRFAFPILSFLALYFLPSVKAVFILTSILFSFIIIVIQNLVWKLKKKPS